MRAKYFKKKRKNIQRYMLGTYFAMACISVFVEIVLCIYVVNNTREQIAQTHQAEINQIISQMDQSMAVLEQQSLEFSRDSSLVKQILKQDADPLYYGESALLLQQLVGQFAVTQSYYSEISRILLLDKSQSVLIDSQKAFHGEQMYEQLDSLGLEMSDFEQIQLGRQLLVQVVGNGTEGYRIFILCGIFGNSYRRPDGYLIIEINQTLMEQKLAMFETGKGRNCYLVENEIGYIGSDPEAAYLVNRILAEKKQTGSMRTEEGSYIYSVASSDYLNLKYCYVTKASLFYRDIYLILLFTGILLITLLSVGFLFARMFARKNTAPLYQMMEVMYTGEKPEQEFSYETLLQEVTGLAGRNQSFEEQRNREYLYQIFNGQERGKKELLNYQRQQAPELEQGFYVMSIRLMNVTEMSDFDILIFCISNIFGELLKEHLALFPVENWDRTYFLLKDKSEEVEAAITQGIHYLEERLSITVAVGLSSRIQYFTELLSGKQQADYMTEYQEMNQHFAQPLCYEDVMAVTLSDKKNYNEDLKKMMHFVMTENYAGARELWEPMCKNASDSSHQNITRSRTQLMTVLSILSIPYREKYGRTGVLQKTDWNTLPEIYEAGLQILDRLEHSEGEQAGKRTFEQMWEYIRQHATEPTITAGAISEAFSLTASYASGMFKKYAGEGILDTIHRERIEQAKKFLRKGYAVQEAATAVGYLDARSFIRVFKKYEGITPGQYKNID